MTHRWGLGKLGAACVALLLAALPVTASAQTFAPVAVVNDQIITTFDLDQRMRLMRAAGSQAGEAALREAAIEELINDRLRMQAARRAGVVPTTEQIQSGFDEISRQNGRDPEEMRRYFTTQGVTQEALAGQIGPEVAWRQLIRQRYMPRMRVSDAEIGDIINSARAGSEAQYLLTEIRMPVDQNGEGAALQKARGILQELVQSGEFAETARRYSNGPTASLGGDLGWVSASAISPTALDVVSKMSADRVSAPFVDGSDVVIYGLRGIRNAGAIAPSKYRLAQLVVGVAPDAPQTEADAAFQRAIAARSQVSDCASVDALREGYLPISGDLGELSFSEMPGPVRQAVGGLEVGEISQPIRSNDGFHIIVVCGKTEITGEDAARNERAREALISRKLARYARAYLKELRREAVIEMR